MRWLAVSVLALVGCAPPVAPPSLPPAAPVIVVPPSSRTEPLRERTVSLVVDAEAGTTVRVFASAECGGPELLRRPAAAARAGLTVELVHGDNVFSAEAVSAEGQASACSSAVTVVARLRMRGELPAPVVAQVVPRNPSPEREVRLRGISMTGWTVSIWSLPGCQGAVLARGSAAQFESEGFALELPFNGSLTVSLDAERGEALSRCSEPVRLSHDGNVPDVRGAFFFPRPPHPWSFGTIVVPGLRFNDALETFEGRECRGRPMSSFLLVRTSCTGPTTCTAFAYPVLLEATPIVSLRAFNQLGSRGPCVTLEHTASLAPPSPFVVLRFGPDGGSVLVGAGTDAFLPELSKLESCDFALSPAALLQTRGAPPSAFYERVEGPLWLRRQGTTDALNCEPVPP
ncbi:MAG: hypothetical protein SFW67_05745 [Myxococcaceae bacterium]|nr:hypothetical protein [Myxococcaceae bacterium]